MLTDHRGTVDQGAGRAMANEARVNDTKAAAAPAADSTVSNAVVAEGGGQRGIYTAGVLDAWGGEGINPFDLGIGVSAGAQNLLAYFLERPGYARQAIERLTAAKGFFVPYRYLTRGNVVDLDSYFERTLSDPDYRLDYPRLSDLTGRRRLMFVATCRDSLQPHYLEPTVDTVVDCLKASSAVPLLYRSGVSMRGRCLIDGGVADPLPVARAVREGARRVLVIRTGGENGSSRGVRRTLQRIRRLRALPASLDRLMACIDQASRQAEAFVADPPDGVELVQITPSRALRSQVFGSRSDALAHDYATGLADGLAHVATLRDWSGSSGRGAPAISTCPAGSPISARAVH